MLYRSSIGALALAAALALTTAGVRAWDETKYPDLGDLAKAQLLMPKGNGPGVEFISAAMVQALTNKWNYLQRQLQQAQDRAWKIAAAKWFHKAGKVTSAASRPFGTTLKFPTRTRIPVKIQCSN